MMKLRIFLAVFACKSSVWLLRLLGRGGTAIPGEIAMRICPELLRHLAKGVRCVIITGTNGKTTSARMVEEIYVKSGVSYLANRSGANLIGGITAIFAEHATLFGRPKKQHAIIECDEAASKEVCRLIDPAVILVTNVFRDQLDRFGEVSVTLNSILTGIKNSPNATLCLNADCSLTASIAGQVENLCIFYGIDLPLYKTPVTEVSDAPYCIRCKHEYEYHWHTFGHLGGFYCPDCGYSRPKPQVSVTEILDMGLSSSAVRVQLDGEPLELVINLPGGYNIYNAAGALAVSEAAGFDRKTAQGALKSFSGGFGRMEKFDLGKHSARMILVKNPAGCNQVLNFLSSLSEPTLFVCLLNDNSGDGKDISWIWDANFETLAALNEHIPAVFVSGIRSAEMALRLKYAGVEQEKLRIIPDYQDLIQAMREAGLPVVIMPTYTAMMDLRAKMSAAFGGKDFWE